MYDEIVLGKKKEQLLKRAMTRLNVKCTVMSDRSQTQKATSSLIPFI